jgi:pro-kumamolisin-like protein
MHTYGRRCGVLAAAALALAVGAAPAGAAGRTTVPGSVPKWASPSRDRGDAPGSQQVTVTVYLPLRNADAANALLAQVSDPSSASYGRFLTPDAFKARFAPSDADVAAVEGFLRGAGLTVTDVPANNHHVEATGTLAQAEAAFATDVHRYAYNGHLLDAPSRELSSLRR